MNLVPVQAIRLILGLLSLFFAYFLGRAGTRLHHYHQPYRKALTWLLRTVVCLLGVIWVRGFDLTSIVFVVLAAAVFAAGVYVESRPRKVEEVHLFDENRDRQG